MKSKNNPIFKYIGQMSNIEIRGFIVLSILLAIISGAYLLYKHFIFNSNIAPIDSVRLSQKQLIIDSIFNLNNNNNGMQTGISRHKPPLAFRFDPNIISEDSIMLLGFSKYAASNWVKYRANGGKFYSNNDLHRIYGLDTNLLKGLTSYIHFPLEKKPFNDQRFSAVDNETKNNFSNEELIIRDINYASLEDLMAIKGIGKKRASTILKYRNLLGGFVSIGQMDEIYGLPPDVIENVKNSFEVTDTFHVNKIKINYANFYQLKKHPYIDEKLAKNIDDYLKKHYYFSDINDFINSSFYIDSIHSKVLPYIDFSR